VIRLKQVFSSAAIVLVLSAGGVVAADQLYVGVERGEVLSEPDSIFGEIIKRVDRGQPVEGDLNAWESGRQRNTFMEVQLPDGASGYIQASALVSEAPGQGDAGLRTSSGAEGAGAAARGLTAEIEGDLSADDPEFALHVQQVDAIERAVNRDLRGSPTGSYDDQDPAALRNNLRRFMGEGGMRHAR